MTFDPYRDWLGLPAGRPHAFALLGISPRETDPAAIRRAADERLAAVRAIRPGDQVEAWTRLLEEITTARDLLSDPERRAAYLDKLRRRREESGGGKGAPSVPYTPSAHDAPATGRPATTASPSANTAGRSAGGRPTESARPIGSPQEAEGIDPMAPFDPMAPLAPAPSPRSPSSPTPAAVPHASANSTSNAAPIVGSPVGELDARGAVPASRLPIGATPSVAARHQERVRKGRGGLLMLGLAGGIFLASLAVTGYLLREPLMAALSRDDDSRTPSDSEGKSGTTAAPANPSDPSANASTAPDSNPGEDSSAVARKSDDDTAIGPDRPVSSDDDVAMTDTNAMMPDENDPEVPDSTDPSDDDSSEGDPEEEAELRRLTRPEGYRLANLLRASMRATAAGEEEEAERLIGEARTITDGTAESEWVDRLQILRQTYDRFWKEVAVSCGQLESSEVLDVTPQLQVVVVEASPERLVYRVSGAREERAPRDLPPGLARFILESVRADDDDVSRLIGAFYAIQSADDATLRERAETAWRTAETAGVAVGPLLAWLSDDYQDLVDRFPPAEVPAEAALTEPREVFEAANEARTKEARTPDEKDALATELVAEATAADATIEAYLQFELAADLAAATGRSPRLEEVLELWEAWFKIDRIATLARLLPKAAKVSASPDECRLTVTLALQAAQQAVGRKRREEAEALFEAANDAAQKSRDPELRASTMQQTRTLAGRLAE